MSICKRPAQAAREDVYRGIKAVLASLSSNARDILNDGYIQENWKTILDDYGPESAFKEMLSLWSNQGSTPTVLMLDEIDALIGDTLISVLRQLRAGHIDRPGRFPQCVILCGVRDVRDYRIHSDKENAIITGNSAFNIKAESLRLGDLTQEEMKALYDQHTADTGQTFTLEFMELAWKYSSGQPWIVNALGYEACFRLTEGRDRNNPITGNMLIQAKENLILRRETHLDQLTDKLQEDRVRRVIGPMLEGRLLTQSFQRDDVSYVVDLGLIRQERNGEIRLANRLYQEIIPRELVWDIQSGMTEQTLCYIREDGSLDMKKLLASFQEFFREHSEHWIERFDYREAGPQLLLQAFLQRIVNSGGRIEREYRLGRMRTDLLVIWPDKGLKADARRQATDDGRCLSSVVRHPAKTQRMVIELKLLYKSLDKTLEQGLMQTWEYMDRCRADEGHLVIFDRSPQKSWEEKLFVQEKNYQEHAITVWGM